MSFSLSFLTFLFIITLLYFALPRILRPFILLGGSLWFVWQLDRRALVALLICSVLVYLAGLLTEQAAGLNSRTPARLIGTLSVVLLVLALLFFKYSSRIAPLLPPRTGDTDEFLTRFLLPIGFSYYVFQAIGYLADIAAGKQRAERNPLYFLLWMCFFPKFISGPIERAENFLPQIRALSSVRFLDADRLSPAFCWILYGFSLKLIVADRIGVYVPKLFEGYAGFHSPMLFFGVFLYSVQIYCDFAGYSALAVGIARIYGLTLTQNFLAPYLADRISGFWRRWHRSLSQWLRDYIYIPLGGNRRGLLRQCLNTAIVFVLCGMWHGNGLNFVAWGALHAVYSVLDILDRQRKGRDHAVTRFFRRLLTFAAVSFAWIFFGASGMTSALAYTARMFTAGSAGRSFADDLALLDMPVTEKNFLLIAILFVFFTDLATYRKKEAFPDLVRRWPFVLRYFFYAALVVLILLFGIYGPGYDAGAFLYMAF
ncbi:MAG: hypothetical protein K6G16_11735 [Lachnospiraceae bacterium]|nr:hypothetical protein [Lachnospiraceae bacterium]